MTSREAALRARWESLRRISGDWAEVASSLDMEDTARGIKDLSHPPSIKKTVRTAGVALAVAPEPFTTVAGVALVASSYAVRGEPATPKSMIEELGHQMSEISDFDFAELTITL